MSGGSEHARIGPPARLLFLHDGSPEILGSERCLLDLVEALAARGYQCAVACNTRLLADAAIARGATAEVVRGWSESAERFLPSAGRMVEARRIVRQSRPHVVHFNSISPIKPFLPVLWARRIPSLLHVHIAEDSKGSRLHSWSRFTSAFAGVSEFAVRGFRDDGVSTERISVIMNAVDMRRIIPVRASEIDQLPSNAVFVGLLGSLIARKRPTVALDAFLRVAHNNDALHLLVIGTGPERQAMEEMIHGDSMRAKVHFLGRREDGPGLLAQYASILLTASGWEAMPLNVLEAQAAGLAVVASDIPPHREAITHGKTGLIAADNGACALGEQLQRILSNPELLLAIRTMSREHARCNLSVARYASEFEQMYHRLSVSQSTNLFTQLLTVMRARVGPNVRESRQHR